MARTNGTCATTSRLLRASPTARLVYPGWQAGPIVKSWCQNALCYTRFVPPGILDCAVYEQPLAYSFFSLGRVLARTRALPHSPRISNPLVHGPGSCSFPTMRGA